MSSKRRSRRSMLLSATAVACVAAAITAVSPAPAYAATGQLTLWRQPDGLITRLLNPAAGCHPVRAGYNFVDNRLNTYVVAFQGTYCTGLATWVQPGTVAPLGRVAYSVQVPN